jgi:hypothetical protein
VCVEYTWASAAISSLCSGQFALLPVDVDRMIPACSTLLERVKSDFLWSCLQPALSHCLYVLCCSNCKYSSHSSVLTLCTLYIGMLSEFWGEAQFKCNVWSRCRIWCIFSGLESDTELICYKAFNQFCLWKAKLLCYI